MKRMLSLNDNSLNIDEIDEINSSRNRRGMRHYSTHISTRPKLFLEEKPFEELSVIDELKNEINKFIY